MFANSDLLPDPFDAGFYVRYVELCSKQVSTRRRPNAWGSLSKWNSLLRGEPVEQSD